MTTLFEQLFPEQLKVNLQASASSLQPNQLSRVIPTGNFNPLCHDEMGGLTDEGILDALEKEHNYLIDLEGKVPPELREEYNQALERFIRNSQKTMHLINQGIKSRRELDPHHWFPFAEDFSKASKELFDLQEFPCVSSLVFEPEVLGNGWFGAVYLASDPFDKSKDFAFKLSRSPRKEKPEHRIYFMKLLNHVRKGLVEYAPDLDQTYFVPFRAISKIPFPNQDERDSDNRLGFLTQRFTNSASFSELVRKNDSRLKDREFLGKVFHFYASALQSVHRQGLVLVDNNWGSLLVNERGKMKVCDYDFLTPEDKALGGIYYPYPRDYRNQESYLQERPTKLGDLESFALMVSHLLLGEPIRPPKRNKIEKEEFKRLAKKDKYEPAGDSLLNLPENLRGLVKDLVSYPRDSSLTAGDFVSAIKDDYGV